MWELSKEKGGEPALQHLCSWVLHGGEDLCLESGLALVCSAGFLRFCSWKILQVPVLCLLSAFLCLTAFLLASLKSPVVSGVEESSFL